MLAGPVCLGRNNRRGTGGSRRAPRGALADSGEREASY